ncbi:MAG: hypothetical protein GY794_05830, partial [bacterium]|nr:hypothetical protein [bacterium]
MTTLPKYYGVDQVIQRLQRVHVRRHTIRMMTLGAWMFAIVAGSLILTTLAGGYWSDQPPGILRWSLGFTCLALWIGSLGFLIVRGALWRQSPAQTARFVEESTPALKNNLINSILLAGDSDQVSGELVQAAINESLETVRDTDLSESISYRMLRRGGFFAALTGLLVALLAITQASAFQRGLTSALAPWKYVPHVNNITGVTITPGDTTVLSGQRVVITANIPALDDQDLEPDELASEILRLKPRVIISGRDRPQLMLGGVSGKFTCDLNAVIRNVEYCVVVGDNRWPADRPWYKIKVSGDIKVKTHLVRYVFPPYT